MKKINVGWCCCAVIALGVLCGCETVIVPPKSEKDARQGDTSKPFLGVGSEVTMYSLESCARQLMSDMRANAGFIRNHKEKMKSKKNEKPTVIVKDIKTGLNVTNHVVHKLIAVRDVIRTELFNSNQFKILPDDAKASPDYVVKGKFDNDAESDGRHYYYLKLWIEDFKKEEEGLVWEGFKNNVNLDL